MQYQDFIEILESADPEAQIMFDDGVYVVGAHKEFGDRIRLFRGDDMGFDLGAPLIPNRDIAAETAEEPDWAESLYRTLTAQCSWQLDYAPVIVSLPGDMYFHNVEYVETADDGTIILSIGDEWHDMLF